ncbi:MAG: nicotinate-nicotinamide nucleotide adenylyltransferase, partial [Prevotella sp.]|nr:nicotinate-nicotinamide nucleotide adenylyltransferase [Prevotella sp.]
IPNAHAITFLREESARKTAGYAILSAHGFSRRAKHDIIHVQEPFVEDFGPASGRNGVRALIRTGILGGTFDPIHKAHTSIAMLAKEALALDEIWLLPDGDPPHKRIQAGGEDRLRMAELAARGYPGFRAIDIEVRRQGTTYTVDTLRQLRAESPERMFVYIIGGDTLDKLPFWHEAEALPALCEIAVIAREERGRAANCSLEEELRGW